MPENTLTETRPETENYCPCQALLPNITREHHDWLLGFEARGLPGAMDLLGHASMDSDEHEPGTLMWMELPQFAALHSWDQPAAVYQFVQLIDDEIRARRARWTARAALESVITIANAGLEQTN